MTATPLPRMPVCKHKDVQHQRRYIGDVYTKEQMQAYATQARADLEAEVQRLSEALIALTSQTNSTELAKALDTARAALEKQP